MIKIIKQKNKGFTILFAVLVSSLVLLVSTSIISVALKQISLSGNARDSQYAFYAANTGVECAIYWDRVGVAGAPPVFATSSDSDIDYTNDGRAGGATCIADNSNNPLTIIDSASITNYDDCKNNDEDLIADIDNDRGWCVDADVDTASSKFRITIDPGGVEYCADVIVTKTKTGPDIYTTIESKGYNTCESEIRRVERGLKITY